MLEPLALDRGVGALHELTNQDRVAIAIGEPGIGWQAVASGAARFLVIGLQAFRKIEMGDEAHVGLVDSHAESDGRHHHETLFFDEALLMSAADPLVEPGVIGQGLDALCPQPRRGVVHLLAAHAIDDAAFAAVPRADEAKKLLARTGLRDDLIANVGPVEPRDEDARLGNREMGLNLAPRGCVGRRG